MRGLRLYEAVNDLISVTPNAWSHNTDGMIVCRIAQGGAFPVKFKAGGFDLISKDSRIDPMHPIWGRRIAGIRDMVDNHINAAVLERFKCDRIEGGGAFNGEKAVHL